MDMRKLCLKWLLRELTMTIYETGLQHFMPDNNRQPAERTARDKLAAKRAKTQLSAGKVLIKVFQNTHDIILNHKQSQKGKNYKPRLLNCVFRDFKSEIMNKLPNLEKKKSVISLIQYTVSQNNQNHGEITRIAFRIAFCIHRTFRSDPQRLLLYLQNSRSDLMVRPKLMFNHQTNGF